jgi:hypothetical protein
VEAIVCNKVVFRYYNQEVVLIMKDNGNSYVVDVAIFDDSYHMVEGANEGRVQMCESRSKL